MLGVLWPEIDGLLPLAFVVTLAVMVAAVGLFALYVVAQQFRNPGRSRRRR